MSQNIDKTNTILHILSDHGSMIGDSVTNLFGRWEISNPVSIMMIPKYLKKQRIVNIDMLKRNEQKMVTHFDLHLFYKELMVQFAQNTENMEINELTLPKLSNGEILSKSIISTEIASDRDCVGIANGFCFCDLFQFVFSFYVFGVFDFVSMFIFQI